MSDRAPSRIEDLANELWLDVFGHLDWINLFMAFHGINKRIDELLVRIKVLSLYSSYFTIHSNAIYIFFQEFPIEAFKQIRHLQLTYDSPYEDALNFAKLLPPFSNLISLTINALFPDSAISDDLATICFHQRCPFLQRLDLHGNAFNRDSPMAVNVSMFHFPSLLYLHVGRIDFNLALQILDLCPQLRSFTANLYGPHTWERTTAPFSIILPTGVRTGLTAMKKLSLSDGEMFRDDYMSTLIELLLPCCPNLRTFSFAFTCHQRTNRALDPHWWTHALASNNKLTRLSIHLRVYGVLNGLSQEAVHAFQSLPFFLRLKVNATYTAERIEFPHMFHIYAIETEEASR